MANPQVNYIWTSPAHISYLLSLLEVTGQKTSIVCREEPPGQQAEANRASQILQLNLAWLCRFSMVSILIHDDSNTLLSSSTSGTKTDRDFRLDDESPTLQLCQLGMHIVAQLARLLITEPASCLGVGPSS